MSCSCPRKRDAERRSWPFVGRRATQTEPKREAVAPRQSLLTRKTIATLTRQVLPNRAHPAQSSRSHCGTRRGVTTATLRRQRSLVRSSSRDACGDPEPIRRNSVVRLPEFAKGRNAGWAVPTTKRCGLVGTAHPTDRRSGEVVGRLISKPHAVMNEKFKASRVPSGHGFLLRRSRTRRLTAGGSPRMSAQLPRAGSVTTGSFSSFPAVS